MRSARGPQTGEEITLNPWTDTHWWTQDYGHLFLAAIVAWALWKVGNWLAKQ
jgi:hypothetical protein